MGFIYKITNKISGKCYIGVTIEKDPQQRWNAHIRTMKNNKGCPALKDAMKKYGVENFKFEVIIMCFDEDVYRYEKEYIKKYNSMIPNGYNILEGGQRGGGFKGKHHTPEAIARMMENCRKFREANPNHFETYREKLKKSMEKVNLSEAVTKSEIFQKAKQEGRLGFNSHKNPEETKRKIKEGVIRYYQENPDSSNRNSEKHKEAVRKALGKPIIQYTKDGDLVREYQTTEEAGRLSGVKRTNIQHALYKEGATAGGFIWKFAQKQPKQPKESTA
jgi:group I intron endonuclease